MKIVLDTDTRRTICPPEFFDNISQINSASELTGCKTKITPESYLEKAIKECTGTIINKKQLSKRRPARNNNSNNSNQIMGELTITPKK